MYVAPGTFKEFGHELTRDAAASVARNWWMLLVNGLLLVVGGVVLFSIDWSERSLATFIGALFVVEGVATALTSGIDARVRRPNVVTGLLLIASGALIIAVPSLGIVVLGIFIGAWLIVLGSITISGSFAARPVMPDWWLLLIIGVLEVPLGVLALASPGATLAALVTVGGVWAVVIGVLRIVLSFELRDLPRKLERTPPTGLASTGT